jgi:hypothetical protein
VKTCPSHVSQPVYCLKCFENDVHPPHAPPDHKPLRVVVYSDGWSSNWNKIKAAIASLQE